MKMYFNDYQKNVKPNVVQAKNTNKGVVRCKGRVQGFILDFRGSWAEFRQLTLSLGEKKRGA